MQRFRLFQFIQADASGSAEFIRHNKLAARSGCGHLGFTLIEVMIALAIVAILITFAAPSMRDMLVNNRLQGVSSDLLADLSLARGTAAAKGQRVTICQSSNGATSNPTCGAVSTWQDGWIVFVDVDGDGVFKSATSTPTAGPDIMIKVHGAMNSSVTVAPYGTTGTPPTLNTASTSIVSVRYRPSGMTTANAAIGFRVCQTGFTFRDIVISAQGRLSSSVSPAPATAQTTTSCS